MSAIGSSSASPALIGHPGRASLEAEITRYQQQLADCVNCPSSKTPQGKANIQEISNKIAADEQQLHQVESRAQPADGPSDAPRGANGYTRSGAPSQAAPAGRGGRLNVYA